ncbi:type IV toxin-antitoxin system AbiEi family antitoxin domain-containing protein [Geoalkalibacter halelectricus]|uniref:Type IV toxin-antitoxin system AbiEi family antitoxin domain-containing protein n=1 Tax=Geoalkalibacter halelectricus TaxID=2847045 RepID=A0ABY5ZP81_9BACT|nr:type IV toxin-antitoxin system AbiEi family antitoxin domain-containing protein [Geoalkalibacter halelectricus]MDO3377125.1 type IV toxin-antitoxin system AbiEi family antitoxin domain-containing protein [Geoalkalibacter halelectricus]UWZ79690.1 type IV toxin-antitoxin system AbiEi family antitoxin domain-containing protein [Geoalkalibacter halelectricus]
MLYDTSPSATILDLARKLGVLRVRDLTSRGIHPEYLRRLCRQGLMVRTGRGLYMAADADISEHHTLAQAAKMVPHGIVCLLSALRFHDIGTQNPHEVWMALERTSARPCIEYPSLRVVRFSGQALTEGVKEHVIEGVTVKVTSPARTVADCFKYRNKIGLDVALEALKECRRNRRCEIDDLWRYAKLCRVANIMRPYLEAMSA